MELFDLDNWQEIWVTISRNKLRSTLTGIGVFWGIFMLIILIGVGNAFEGGMKKNVGGFASNSCFFQTKLTSVPYKGYRKGRAWTMNSKDLELIRKKASAVEYISPVLFLNQGGKNIVRGNKSGSYGIRGVYPDQFEIEKQNILRGRLFNPIDIKEKRKVCLLGKEVYETLFPKNSDPLGEYIRANGIYFQVVGVIAPKSNVQMGGRSDATVYLPFRTMQQAFGTGDSIYFMSCTAKYGYPASLVIDQVSNILKQSHQIAPTDQKAIKSFNIEHEFQAFDMLFTGINILIWIVGLGALFSGIIGISNIMLVTVRERTKEIGVRRAIGAKPITIVRQIISESFVLTALSGIIGFLCAVGLLELISYFMEKATMSTSSVFLPPHISFNMAVIAMLVLIILGVAAGLMPAMRALSIKPIDAIREE